MAGRLPGLEDIGFDLGVFLFLGDGFDFIENFLGLLYLGTTSASRGGGPV
jgi:hypothetical protein